jgi:hypothetical protein
MHAFWRAATALDAAAADLSEDKCFGFCTREGLIDLARSAGLTPVDLTSIEVATVFSNFEDYWRPFTLGAGPHLAIASALSPKRGSARRPACKKIYQPAPMAQFTARQARALRALATSD